MTERIESFSDINYVQLQEAAFARNWFENQAAQFRQAQVLVVQTGGAIDTIRELREPDEVETGVGVRSKAMDAIKSANNLRSVARLMPGTDIYRQHTKNVVIELLGARAATAMVQADRREQEYLSTRS